MRSRGSFIFGTNFISDVNACRRMTADNFTNRISILNIFHFSDVNITWTQLSVLLVFFFPSVHEKMASLLSAILVPWLWSRNPKDSIRLGDVHPSCKQHIWWFLSLCVPCQKCDCTRQLLPGSGHQSPMWVTLTPRTDILLWITQNSEREHVSISLWCFRRKLRIIYCEPMNTPVLQ